MKQEDPCKFKSGLISREGFRLAWDTELECILISQKYKIREQEKMNYKWKDELSANMNSIIPKPKK